MKIKQLKARVYKMNSINNINSVSDNVQFKGFGILSKAAIIERKQADQER